MKSFQMFSTRPQRKKSRYVIKKKKLQKKNSGNYYSTPRVLQISYAIGAVVNAGNELTLDETGIRPINVNWVADPNIYYTFIMVGKK